MEAISQYSVLEVGEYVAVPYAGKLFSDLGADVLKIEPREGDVARRVGPFEGAPDPDASGFFGYLNTGKRSVTLARGDGIAPDVLCDLIETEGIDLVIEEDLVAYGVDPVELAEAFPDLSVVSLSAFGATGPYREYDAPELVAMAESGHVNKMGYPDEAPLRPRIKSADYWAGQYVALSGVSALLARDLQGGDGRYVDVSKRAAAVTYMEGFVAAYSWQGATTERTGYGYPDQGDQPGYPAIFETRDGYVSISPSGGSWEAFCTDVLERPELVDDERFATPSDRTENLDAIREVIQETVRARGKWELLEEFQAVGIPSAVTATPEDVAEFEHLKEREFWQDVPLSNGEEVTMPGFAFRLNKETIEMERPPRLGEHNKKVYGEAGFDLERLESAEVI